MEWFLKGNKILALQKTKQPMNFFMGLFYDSMFRVQQRKVEE